MSSGAEAKVLRWFLVAFFAVAIVVILGTWWQKSRACNRTCIPPAQGELRFLGGGRFARHTQCVCVHPDADD